MKGLLFFLVLLGIAFAVWSLPPPSEGFQSGDSDAVAVATPEPNIPLVSPRYQTLAKGSVQPFAPPSTSLLAPPPGQSASVNTQPATNPSMQKATSGRIQSVYQSMVGFFQTDAAGLQKIGDPSVQLPLSTARSDRGRLKDELDTLKKNPGLESSLTMEDVDGIEANLGFLQKKWRQSTNAMSGGPMPPEGFQSGARAGGWFEYFFGGTQEGFQTGSAGTGSPGSVGTGSPGSVGTGSPGFAGTGSPGSVGTGSPGFAGTGSPGFAGTGSPGSAGSGSGSGALGTGPSDVTLQDVQNLSLRLNIEIVRLQSSGTTDLTTQSRINTLTSIKQSVDDLIKQVLSGTMKISNIPLMKADIAKFLPAMENLNTAMPDIITKMGGNTWLSSLFSKYSAGDVSGSEIAEKMFEKYGNELFNNLSWDITVGHKGKAEQDIARNYARAMSDARHVAENPSSGPAAFDASGASAYRGLFESIIKDMTGMEPKSVSVGARAGAAAGAAGGMGAAAGAGAAAAAGGHGMVSAADVIPAAPPASFDWKQRSQDICKQITNRGMDPNEFGCLANPNASTQANFSWRGHARMVCTRLATVYDPSVPELCGCPPAAWPGWRP